LLETGGLPPVDKTMNPKIALFLGWMMQNVFRLFRIKTEPSITPFYGKAPI
jgi:hypothetical protein